ncbi:hypothetical protein METBIDRAFT_182167 [Metschnikowia bicuspidata var. bicuspidata NRRL YB-4993]|uniref:Uncharacterized protein n=1 Tax=Metschnikowia bicuspidata var. bicuspidata NRRL YB-4993 TaxID=869754 RepID=A0A1A0HBJ3_9ASCO|nr:hypothetical protein METBIDRAFT_182167 [Metschnikowia bicuspidata var. bicuspidata NRRL YB-4993]OBA21381.1 hypothetical protein METBIDRAFT_182167 [Metschnikowia bicuspidata var. bicuspidata NRRL YB-4993]
MPIFRAFRDQGPNWHPSWCCRASRLPAQATHTQQRAPGLMKGPPKSAAASLFLALLWPAGRQWRPNCVPSLKKKKKNPRGQNWRSLLSCWRSRPMPSRTAVANVRIGPCENCPMKSRPEGARARCAGFREKTRIRGKKIHGSPEPVFSAIPKNGPYLQNCHQSRPPSAFCCPLSCQHTPQHSSLLSREHRKTLSFLSI